MSQSKIQNVTHSNPKNGITPNTKSTSSAPANIYKPTDKRNESSKGFAKVIKFLCCSYVEDDLLLPVNNDSALNRLADQLQPGEVLSSVPVYKLPLTDASGAQGNAKTKTQSKDVLKPTSQKTKPSEPTADPNTISEELEVDPDVATSMEFEGPTTSNGQSGQADLLQDFIDQSRFNGNDTCMGHCASFHVSFSGQMMGSGHNTQYKVLTMSLQLTKPLVIGVIASAQGTTPQRIAHTAPSDCVAFATANSSRTAINEEYEEDEDLIQ